MSDLCWFRYFSKKEGKEVIVQKGIKTINPRVLGILLVVTGSTLWGISGTVAQYLFQQKGFTAEWLVVIRLLCSGVIMLTFTSLLEKRDIFAIWKSRNGTLSIILFSVLGMLGVQYTYFAAIEAGNAASATILQYLAPIFVTAYLVIRDKRSPSKKEVTVLFIALLGTFLLITNGNIKELSISNWAVFWGIASAITAAFYTLQPYKLIKEWGTSLIVGWGMLIGGLFFSFVRPPWSYEGEFNGYTASAILFVVVFGTLIAFFCYLESLKYISASETSLLACTEPLSAAFLSVIWLQVTLGFYQWLGTVCIIITISILSYKPKKQINF